MSTTNPLLQNLVPAPSESSPASATSFADAMTQMGISSVFDIIRQPKQAFARQLSTLSDANGELAYDNALCYASQIGRSYREDVVSSGRSVADVSQRSGVRALVDIGPSYPNLFRENWDQFCKVGAIEAMDGPVAYLGSLRRFAEQRIEGASDSPKRIPLSVRRPDLDKLVIDEQSTYQSIPMLELVNRVLKEGIDKYQVEKGDARPVQELLAEKKHPFVFPYHFAHQQANLALSGDKPALGELNYALATLPYGAATQPVEQANALVLLSGLSPAQQLILIEPAPFAALSRTLGGAVWYSPIQSNIDPWSSGITHFNIPTQDSVLSVSHQTQYSLVEITVKQDNSTRTMKLRAHSLRDGYGNPHPLTQTHTDSPYGACLRIDYDPEDNDGNPLEGEFHGTLLIDVMLDTEGSVRIARRLSVDICTGSVDGHNRTLTDEEVGYIRERYGIEQTSFGRSSLSEVKVLLEKSEVDAQQLQSLLCQKDALPRLSPNCPIVNRTGSGNPLRCLPTPMTYGAVFINGSGGQDRFNPGTGSNQYNNALTFWQESSTSPLQLGNSSLDRFDRMQRMVRLQRWIDIPFAELDTLITSAMRAEGDANPGLHANRNTLRMLGAYRYFNREYAIGAEEFAAFVHDITPFASGDKVPLFDRVFNSPMLFGAPLRLDQTAFTQATTDAAAQKTISQLCAGLGLSPDADSFGLLAANVVAHVGPLKRSLKTVSALYRQARIAKMFGLNAADFQYVLEAIGGADYRRLATTGAMAPPTDQDEGSVDVLDILMQLDATIRWLKLHKLTVAKLRDLLTEQSADTLSAQALERLHQLADDARTELVTGKWVAELRLPAQASGTPIDWHAQLLAKTLIDTDGLITAREFTVQDTDHEQLVVIVREMISSLGLAPTLLEPTVQQLSDALFDRLTRQQRLVEAYLQEYTGLLPEQALLVGHWVGKWTGVTTQHLLTCLFMTWPVDGEMNEINLTPVLQHLPRITNAARIVTLANLSPRALRTFIVNPDWLGVASLWPLALTHVQLLEAYDTLLSTLGQPEGRLLGYLEQANTTSAKRLGKRQLAEQAQTCNAQMATLLGWSESEVAIFTAKLPEHRAGTVAHIDWLRRAQAIALQTGLNAATLLKACDLTAESPDADWQAVGQAAMAAVR